MAVRCCAPRSALTIYTDPGPHSGGNKQARRLCQWPEGCAVYARAQGLCTHHAKQQLPQSQRRKFHAILAVQSRAAKRLRSDPDMQCGCPVPAASSKSVAIEDNAYARTPTLAFGQMSQRCAHCRALYLAAEQNTTGKFTLCCKNGKAANLPPVSDVPEPLRSCLTRTDQRGTLFRQKIRCYNAAMSCVSFGANLEIKVGQSGTSAPPICIGHGAVYHHSYPLRATQTFIGTGTT